MSAVKHHPADVRAWERLLFSTESDASEFYSTYANSVGFSIRKSHVYRDSKGKTTDIPFYLTFMCHKEGFKRQKKDKPSSSTHTRKDTRTGCTAAMKLKMNVDKGGYVITMWTDSHNHPLIDADKRHFLPSNRSITEQQALIISNNVASGISARATFDIMARSAGGVKNLGFLRSDLKNHLQVTKAKALQPGEAFVLQSWFREQAYERPGFFYDIEVDIDQAICSIFWADPVMRADYAMFGDFVSFDTTYRTNKNYRPLGMFPPHLL